MEKVRNSPATKRRRGARYKLTRSQAQDVRQAYETSDWTVEEIAHRFGVTKQTIYNVMARLRKEAAQGPIAGWK